MSIKLWRAILFCVLAFGGCAPPFRQVVIKNADGSERLLPLPKRCTPVEDLHLRKHDVRMLSDYISESNYMEWRVDIRRHDVCISALVNRGLLGLYEINSGIKSHWQTTYFIKGSKGVSVISWPADSASFTAELKATLARHQADFSPEEVERIMRYFDK